MDNSLLINLDFDEIMKYNITSKNIFIEGLSIPLFLFLCISTHLLFGQKETSDKLDSIHNLSIDQNIKNELYYNHLQKLKENQDYYQLGHDAHHVSRWLYKQKKTEKAAEIAGIAVKGRQKANPYNPTDHRRSQFNLGFYNKKNGNYALAITYFNQLLKIEGSYHLNGRAYVEIGDCYSKLNDHHHALRYVEQSLIHYDIRKDYNKVIRSYIKLGIINKRIRNKENSKAAISHLLKADSLVKVYESKNNRLKYQINFYLGALYRQSLFDYKKAIKYFEETLINIKELNRPILIGQTYYALGLSNISINPNKALQYFNKSLEYKENPYNNSNFFGIAEVYFKSKSYEKADFYYKKSLSHIFNQNTLDSLFSINKKKLIEIKDKTFLLEILKSWQENLIAWGQDANEPTHFNKVIQITKMSDLLIDILLEEDTSNNTKLFWRDVAAEIYILGLEASYLLQDQEYAFYLIEKSKALLLIQDLDRRNEDIPATILDTELRYENNIVDLELQLKKASNKIKDSLSNLSFNIKEKFQNFKDSLRPIYPIHFSETPEVPKVISLKNVTPKPNQVILQFSMSPIVAGSLPRAYGMMTSSKNTTLFKITDIEELISNIKTLRKLLQKPFITEEEEFAYYSTAYNIYDALFSKEIQNQIKGKKVTIVADNILNFIPFEALVTDNKTNTYLIEECEISYEYSLSFSKKMESIKRNADKEFFGIAPIEFSDKLTPLKGSKNEIQTGSNYYTGDLLIKEKATKENFIKEVRNYKILHLATHADASDSIMPWIAFKNKKLLLPELNVLKSEAELVLLSACNTSLGKLYNGEGVSSLARGFFKSGANTVLPSLWNTNDKATATITGDFYKNLSEGKTKSKALHLAKLNYLHNNEGAEASPHYWAPLVLIGDTGTLIPESNGYWVWLLIGVIVLIIVMFSYRSFKTSK
ncbi:CHAT domain-containing tetratricopeptide repeat protein [Aquimarina sp. 2201CG5-10]|uniref:CHAT domain-containing tetratricopeptide repeat protein n=1 Tax=Aquimarina callyspongiae TaxID=3098150 RepID=UPI002AB41A06|nr:CHAT domain-containing tetratricopeptide repeat protein [Aquimarina sp. 2201CG5-10]MDY8137836.1 CHAT domain-containing tetratricopeptide repeat protein [Aquimarina sp. 2201CG5-10]